MRRLASIAAFVVLLALPLWAQRGGGGHAGGGGFGGHGGGFAGGGHALSGGTHSFPSSSGMARGYAHSPSFSEPLTQRGFANRGFANRGFSNRGGTGLRLRSYGFRNNCRGYGCWGYGYPWMYGGYYDPYWWSDSGSYDDSYEQDLANANEMNQQSLDQQNLQQQQQMLQQEQADGDRDIYARSDPRLRDPRPSGQPQGTAILPATVLVFRDRHQQEIQNYAIVGQTLWNFAPQRTQKIPLSELDLPATEKANDDRGLTFKVPASNEGQ